MRARLSIAACFALLAAPACAQTSPAQMGVTSTTTPEQLQVLDKTNAWVTIGTIDPTTHAFASPLVPFWAAGDGYVGTDGAMTSGSNILTSAGRPCTPADVGISKVVVVSGAGAPDVANSIARPLHTYVASCGGTGGTSYVLADPSLNAGALTADMWSIATDQSAALNAFLAAHPHSHILLPCGGVGLDAATITLSKVWIQGCGVIAPSNNTGGGGGATFNNGTTLIITTDIVAHPLQTLFQIYRSVRTSDFNMIWPGNYGVSVNPVAYGPAFTDDGAHILTNWTMDYVNALNAYEFFHQTAYSKPISTIWWHNNQMYSIFRDMYIQSIGEGIVVSSLSVNPNSAGGIQGGYGGANNLNNWSQNNGVFYTAQQGGVGGGPCDANHVSLHASQLSVRGVNIVFQLLGAHFQETELVNADVGVANQLFNADAGSVISGTLISNGFFDLSTNSTGTPVPIIDYQGTCTGQGGGSMILTGNNMSLAAGLANFASSNMKSVTVTGNKINSMAGTLTAPANFWLQNDVSTVGVLSGNSLISAGSGANDLGIGVVNAKSMSIAGNSFSGFYNALDTSAFASGTVLFGENTVAGSGGTFSVNVPTAAVVRFGANTFDKSPSWLVANLGTCNALNEGAGPYEVTDATAATYNTAVTGGGAVKSLVYCMTGAWKSH